MSNSTPEPLSAGGDLAPTSTGTLNLRPEVLQGFLAIRLQHEQLQATMHQMMRRIALPRAKAIGEELARLKGIYAPGKSGPAGHSSRFYADAKAITGLSKPTIANYIQLARGYDRLVDYMADLPEGATPITTMKGALQVLRELNRPLRPADGAIDVDAAAVDGVEPLAAGGGRRTRYAASAREKVLPALSALRATTVITDRQRKQLAQIEEALSLLLDAIDRQEEQPPDGALPVEPDQGGIDADQPVVDPAATHEPVDAGDHRQLAEQAPALESEPAVAAGPEAATTAPKQKKHSPLASRYERSAEGLARLGHDIAVAGSGSALARALGVSPQAVADYRKRLKAALEVQGSA